MSSKKGESCVKELPDVVTDARGKRRYRKGIFMGKGGFARCYEFTDMSTGEIWAGKVVPKELLQKPSNREKMMQEINIHKSLDHENIVQFKDSFEDSDNVYIILEICRRRSLMEMQKRRKCLSEAETRYFTKQLLRSCAYLHGNGVIHRDLKLGNVFLNDQLTVKLGDFGLATRVVDANERKKTMCGTPNYIAPEVLDKRGHTFAVDTWSTGCMVFTLLLGTPPFETSTLKETYKRIRAGSYNMPDHVSPSARDFVASCLSLIPENRPSMTQLLQHPWLVNEFIPAVLPASCLTTRPAFPDDDRSTASRIPLTPLCLQENEVISSGGGIADEKLLKRFGIGERESIQNLYRQVAYLLKRASLLDQPLSAMSDHEEPSNMPVYWISKWVDYSDKYGLGYQLCDNSFGVLFKDETRLILTRDNQYLQYISRDCVEKRFPVSNIPDEYTKKHSLITHFQNYMDDYLVKAGADYAVLAEGQMVRLPFMHTWFRNSNCIVMHLSNGTLQMNLFSDHTKLILCPLMSAVTFIDHDKQFRIFSFKTLAKVGLVRELYDRIKYAVTMMEQLLHDLKQPLPDLGNS